MRQFSTPILYCQMILREIDSVGSNARREDESHDSGTCRSLLKGVGNS